MQLEFIMLQALLILVLTIFYSVYTAVIFSVMSKFFKNDEKLLLISYEKSVKYLMIVMMLSNSHRIIFNRDNTSNLWK